MKNPIKEYREVQIQTASQEQLILMMYEHAVKAVQAARAAMPIKKYDTVSNNIIKAQDIVTELMVSLKMDAGPIAQNLYRLYDYMNRRLIAANMKKDPAILDEVEKMLTDLMAAWDEAFRKNISPAPASSPQSASARPPASGSGGTPGGFSISG